MRKFYKLILPLLLTLIACAIIFTACDEGNIQQTPPTESGEQSTPHVHSFGEDWKSDAKTHYKECECGEKTLVSAHVDKNENGSCDICLAKCEDEGIGAGVIALIVIGSVAVLGGGGFCVYWFVIKKKLTQKS